MDMKYRYALIDNGVVDNVILANYFNATTTAHNLGFSAIQVELYPVQPGDTYDYDTGEFFRDGLKIERELSVEENISSIKSNLDVLQNDVIEALIIDNLAMTEALFEYFSQSGSGD